MTRPATPSGSAIAMPVPTSRRPSCGIDDALGRAQVVAGVAAAHARGRDGVGVQQRISSVSVSASIMPLHGREASGGASGEAGSSGGIER